MKENIKNKIEDWKTLVDHLEAQLGKGTEEAKEEFEKQKENLRTWLNSMSDKLDKAKVKASLEELRVHSAVARVFINSGRISLKPTKDRKILSKIFMRRWMTN
jgi:ElaB/YqjD/DUF883 family membrane-anchored ribosome-binding protein